MTDCFERHQAELEEIRHDRPVALAAYFHAYILRKHADHLVDAINAVEAKAKRRLQDHLEGEGIPKLRLATDDGMRTAYLKQVFDASYPKGRAKDVIAWLAAEGYDDVATVHPGTLASCVKEIVAHGKELPEIVSVYEGTAVQFTGR